jgi:hypothetical protein
MTNSQFTIPSRRQWLAAAALLAITGFQRTALAPVSYTHLTLPTK